jgi:hypothetical protein
MNSLKKKRVIAYVLTIITLANIWASLACEMPGLLRGVTSMATVILIGITIVLWAGFLKSYIAHEIDKKNK